MINSQNTSMKLYLFILICLLGGFINSFGQPKKIEIAKVPLVKYFEPSTYNGGIQNWAFSQDTSGILYTANNFGLLEFDGSNWFHYEVPNSTKIRSVFIDEWNRIFIGSDGQIGYFTKSNSALEYVSLSEQLPPEDRAIEEVWKIIQHDGKVFFNTSYKLFVFDNEVFYSINLIGEIELVFKVQSKLIVQFVGKGLFEFENDEFNLIAGTETLTEVNTILDDGNDFIILSTSGDIHRYSNGKLSEIETEIYEDLQSTTINACLRLSNEDIAIGTQNQGLFLLNSKLHLKNHFTKNKGLHNRTVLALLEDDFQNIWVGLNNGINYLEINSPLSLINEEVWI